MAVFGGGDVEDFGFLDQGANPVNAPATIQRAFQGLGNLVQAFDGEEMFQNL